MTLLHTNPEARELVVERAKFVRYAQANGTYDNCPEHARRDKRSARLSGSC
jgi:hypothetical protein